MPTHLSSVPMLERKAGGIGGQEATLRADMGFDPRGCHLEKNKLYDRGEG